MGVVRKAVYLLIFAIVFGCGIIFLSADQNDQIITLNPVILPAVESSVASVVILAFCVGGLLGMLFSISMYLKSKGQSVQVNRKLKSTEKELEKLRSAVVKD